MNKEQPEALPVRLAKRLCDGISTGHDWPNTDDELLRMQSAAELRRLHDVDMELQALRAQIGQGVPDGDILQIDAAVTQAQKVLSDWNEWYGTHGKNAQLPPGGIVKAQELLAVAKSLLASAPPAPQANKTHVLVPLRMTRAMQDVVSEGDWSWADLLAAAEAVTEDEFAVAEQTEPIMPQAAVMQQKPLLFSEIWDNDAIMEVNADARLPFEMIKRFVRAIEAAHNIGEKK